MSKHLDVKITLFDILGCAKKCIEFTKEMSFDSFVNDPKTISAVLHQLMVMGEAVNRLGSEFESQNPVLPWRKIAGTRNVLIHHYEGTDLKIVWDVLQLNIPVVAEEVEKLLAKQN